MPSSRANLLRLCVVWVVFVTACGAGDERASTHASDGAPPTSEGGEVASERPSAIAIGSPTVVPTGPDTQPIQPSEVPTPIEGVLGNQWQCTGEVDASRMQAQLDAAAADFRECFVNEMVAGRLSQVDVQLLARVDKSGSVTDHVVRSEPRLAGSISCAERVLRALKLVRPRGGNCVVLDYPLRFSIRY